jgi:hypothetical protein
VDTPVRAVLALSGLLTVACWIWLWRGPDRLVGKIVWSLLSAFPILGPLLYAVLHDPPPVQDEVDRAQGPADWDGPPPGSHGPP